MTLTDEELHHELSELERSDFVVRDSGGRGHAFVSIGFAQGIVKDVM